MRRGNKCHFLGCGGISYHAGFVEIGIDETKDRRVWLSIRNEVVPEIVGCCAIMGAGCWLSNSLIRANGHKLAPGRRPTFQKRNPVPNYLTNATRLTLATSAMTSPSHEYLQATATDSRSPCPALNALANHGHL